MAFFQADLAELNRKPGSYSFCLAIKIARKPTSAAIGFMIAVTIALHGRLPGLCHRVDRCGSPCEAKIEESPGQFLCSIGTYSRRPREGQG